MKQHFSSAASQHSQSTTASTPAAESESHAHDSNEGAEQSNRGAKPAELSAKEAAEISKHLHEHLQRELSGKHVNDLTGQIRNGGSASLPENSDSALQMSNAEQGSGSSSDGLCMSGQDMNMGNAPSELQPSSTTCSANATLHRPDALTRRICPAYGHPAAKVLSVCHLVDAHPNHACKSERDCGVDSSTCRPRVCSLHGFCQAG